MTNYRTEVDSMGEVQVPINAYYSSQTHERGDREPLTGRHQRADDADERDRNREEHHERKPQ